MNEEVKQNEVKDSPKDKEEAKVSLEDFLPHDVYSLIKSFVAALSQQAWVYMGLIFNPKTKNITRDLAQAKMAIDCADFLFQKIKENCSANEVRELNDLIANLQLNFVEQSRKG